MPKAIVVTSGGMDSTTAVYLAYNKLEGDIGCISFNYGQRHSKELFAAQNIASRLGVPHETVDISSINHLLTRSVLTNHDRTVPEGHYEKGTMKQTVVPNRNSIMANIAAAWAIDSQAEALWLGVHAGDHAVYPDCRAEFIWRLESLLHVANEGFIASNFEVYAPFVDRTKADIVYAGMTLEVPYELTWTCYKGGDTHCGRCSTCVERLEAFHLAGFEDPVEYLDREYYKEVCDIV